ncbi:HEAT repeat domain-containing protein [Micromonospora sp. NPDC005298]|uniref:HEAT repeat domain-containing protein n=1 Tax=Micromonospora sp. NPDC005298 TaxID=3156873 RepID=UPI0033B00945
MPEELQQLTGPDRVLRGEALDRLVDLAAGGDERAVRALRTVVAGYRQFDPEIYTRALNRLWLFGDATLEEPLLVALADEQYGCQAWTARACGQLGISAAEPLLIDLLEHPDGLTRESACQALGSLSSSAAIQPLTRRLDDPAEFVRAAASEALADIGSDDALAPCGPRSSPSYSRGRAISRPSWPRSVQLSSSDWYGRPAIPIRRCGSGLPGLSARAVTSGLLRC